MKRKPRRSGEASPLTRKQSLFVELYVALGNGAKAYRAAYDADRMAPETVHREASLLLKNPKVTTRIQLLQAELSERSRHTLDTTLAEIQRVYEQAMRRNTLKAAVDALHLKAKLLGFDRGPPKPDAAGSGPDYDLSVLSSDELVGIEQAIVRAAEAAEKRQHQRSVG